LSRVAGLVQGCIWIAFFPAMLVPDTALSDPGKQFGQIGSFDLNLFGAIFSIVLLVTALILLQGGRRS